MMTDQPCGDPARIVPDAPPSVRAVLETLCQGAPLTMKGMQEQTGLGRRTLYTVIRRLRETGLLRERVNLQDTRQTFYWIDDRPTPDSI